ncbi:hypothetical protein ACFVYT_34775 [Streptomyces sp. NPDC058290]|uniref:hypothetical protein n=1 Tax=Streptomyces sp. NPDC058290 TaxID=3346426 RepID=UPI0036EE0D92
MSKMVFWVLDVGQGSGNFIQVFDDSDKLVGSVLIDIGSKKSKKAAGGPSVKTVAGLLGDPATLNLVVLSHGDGDHINLIPELLDELKSTKLTVNRVCYGGSRIRYKGGSNSVLSRLEAHMPSGVTTKPLSPGFSSFTATDPPEPFDTFGELEVWILKANAATSDAKSSSSSDGSKRQRVDGGYDINTDSVVVLLGFPLSKAWFVVTGDATATTMYQVNEVVNDSVKKKYLQHVVMMTVPHHGSTSTSFDVRGGGEATLKTFAEKIEPVSVIGSADKVGTYKQPSARVLQYFWPYVTVGEPFWGDPAIGGRHFYTAYFAPDDHFNYDDAGTKYPWPAGANWYSVQTASDIYTNMYVDRVTGQQDIVLPPDSSARHTPNTPSTPRALGVAWQYTVQKNTVTLQPVVNRKDYERMVAARGFVPAGWPDPATLGDALWVSLPAADTSAAADAGAAGPAAAAPEPALPRRPAPTSRRPLPRLRELP